MDRRRPQGQQQDNGIVRQSVGKAWWDTRSADGPRFAVGGRRRRRDARGAPRAAGSRRLARSCQRFYRARPRAGGRRHRRQVGHPRPDGGQDRPRRTGRHAWFRRPDHRSQCGAAGRHHDGRPARLRQNHHHRKTRPPHDPARQAQGADGLARHLPPGGDGAIGRAGARPRHSDAADRGRPEAGADREARPRSRQAWRLRRGAARHRRPHHARRRNDERGGRDQNHGQSARGAAGRGTP